MPLRDLALAWRTLRNSPIFTLTAAVTIALGVGASTAIFSVTNAVLLRPLPYKDPEQLVILPSDMRNRGVKDFPYSNADFIDLRDGTNQEFEGLAGVFTFPLTLTGDDGLPEQANIGVVTTNYFRLVGARIVVGRDFDDHDGQPQPPPPAPGTQTTTPPPPRLPIMAIISYEYFQRRFGSNANVIGKVLNQGKPFSPRIVGVLAPHFQIYFPASANLEAAPEVCVANRLRYDAAQRNNVSMLVIGRLRPGVTIERAQAAADQVASEERKNFVILNTAGYAIRVVPMRQHLVSEVRPAILADGRSDLPFVDCVCQCRESSAGASFAAQAGTGGSLGYWRELVGFGEADPFGGTVAGGHRGAGRVGDRWAGIHEMLAIAPAHLPRVDTIRIDLTVLIFTIVASLVAAAIFGLAPAWRAARPDVMMVLRGTSRSEGLASGGFSRKIVVGVEVALAYVLLIGLGLMVRSFMDLQRIDPGFRPQGLLTFQVATDRILQKAEERAVTTRQLEERLRAIPGIQSVTASTPFPLTGGYSPIRWGKEEALSDPSKYMAADPLIVLPGYFETMHTKLLEGRTFADEDNQPGHTQVVVDKMLAERAYPGQSAIGKRILIRIQTPEPVWVEIIGVVEHERGESLSEPGREEVYFTDAYVDSGAVTFWALRTGQDPARYAEDVRATLKAFDPHLLITDMQPMDAVVEKAQAGTRFQLMLIGSFAVIAAVLAGVGLYVCGNARDGFDASGNQSDGPIDVRNDGCGVLLNCDDFGVAAGVAGGGAGSQGSASGVS